MNIIVMARNGQAKKLLTRYWRCNLKQPLDCTGMALTNTKEFQKYLNWCKASQTSESLADNYTILDENANPLKTPLNFA